MTSLTPLHAPRCQRYQMAERHRMQIYSVRAAAREAEQAALPWAERMAARIERAKAPRLVTVSGRGSQ